MLLSLFSLRLLIWEVDLIAGLPYAVVRSKWAMHVQHSADASQRTIISFLLRQLDQKLPGASVMFFGSTSGLSVLMFVERTKRYKDTDKMLCIYATQTIHAQT